MLGIFGAPVAHGDDAERAVRTALAIRDSLNEMNVGDPELDLQARLAVNTGEVIVDLDARPEAGDSMIVGDVVNTAARLQSRRRRTASWSARETFAATRTAVEYEPAPPVIAKGKAAPVEAWLALSRMRPRAARALRGAARRPRARARGPGAALETGVRGAAPAPRHSDRPGRDRQEPARRGVRALRRHDGGRPLRGRSAPYGDSSAYGAFAQHVKQVAEIFDNETRTLCATSSPVAVRRELTENLALFLGFETERAVDRESLFFAARRFVESVRATSRRCSSSRTSTGPTRACST